jgi:hypothetical protein
VYSLIKFLLFWNLLGGIKKQFKNKGGIKMKCYQCEADTYGIRISKKGKGLFNKVSAKPKAAVCPNCGYVALYIDEHKEFSE